MFGSADVENILRAHDWLQYSRIIDLHGNSGKFLATVLSAKGHQKQKGILVQPQVLAQEGAEGAAAKIAESYGVSDQMSFSAGDLHRAGGLTTGARPVDLLVRIRVVFTSGSSTAIQPMRMKAGSCRMAQTCGRLSCKGS